MVCINKTRNNITTWECIEASSLIESDISLDCRHGVVNRLLQLQLDSRTHAMKLAHIDL